MSSFRVVLSIAVFFAGLPARAGMFEISGSGSYRRSVIDADSTDESRSITGSLAYFISEATAIETSYTDGLSQRQISFDKPNGRINKTSYKTIGLDLIYTVGSRESAFRPYLKIGANYIVQKRIVDQYRDASGNLFEANTKEDEPGIVPSAGLGFRIGLTESLAFKTGVDAWTSQPVSGTTTIDYVFNAGLSLMF